MDTKDFIEMAGSIKNVKDLYTLRDKLINERDSINLSIDNIDARRNIKFYVERVEVYIKHLEDKGIFLMKLDADGSLEGK